MTTGIIVVILVVICVFSIKSYAKKVSSGCCGTDAGDRKIRVKDKNVKNYPYVVRLKIEGMTCKNCKTRVENAFNCQSDFWAKVDLKNNVATVMTKRPVSVSELEKVVEHMGYTVVETTA